MTPAFPFWASCTSHLHLSTITTLAQVSLRQHRPQREPDHPPCGWQKPGHCPQASHPKACHALTHAVYPLRRCPRVALSESNLLAESAKFEAEQPTKSTDCRGIPGCGSKAFRLTLSRCCLLPPIARHAADLAQRVNPSKAGCVFITL
jgi:hypothetical protein